MNYIHYIYNPEIKSFIDENSFDVEDLISTVSEEMSQFENPLDIIMHTFEWNDRHFIILPGEHPEAGKVLMVDFCEYKEMTVDEGFFKGKKFQMPIASSQKRTIH